MRRGPARVWTGQSPSAGAVASARSGGAVDILLTVLHAIGAAVLRFVGIREPNPGFAALLGAVLIYGAWRYFT